MIIYVINIQLIASDRADFCDRHFDAYDIVNPDGTAYTYYLFLLLLSDNM
jgi:hypothetical protein